MRKIVTALVALGMTAGLVSPAMAATDPDRTEIHQRVIGVGGAVSQLPNEYNGDYLRFAFDARLDVVFPDNVDYGGTFHVWHHLKDGSIGAEFRGEITCLLATADYATLSGEITEVVVGDQVAVGRQADFSIVGNTRKPRVGFGGEAWGGSVGDPCSAPAPYFPITDGGYLVHADGM